MNKIRSVGPVKRLINSPSPKIGKKMSAEIFGL